MARGRPNKVVFWAAATSLSAGGFVVLGADGMMRPCEGEERRPNHITFGNEGGSAKRATIGALRGDSPKLPISRGIKLVRKIKALGAS